ncbi:MAG: beta-ketoacyl-ACP synthase III [Sphaerochaetaceae bacterium]|jgi:3-oxoacyl-[acyl-carrier-protein] synthase-3
MRQPRISIRAVGSYVPPKRVSNEELSLTVDTTDEWIRSHTGITNRFIADDHTSTSDLAVLAVRDMMSRYHLESTDIGAIVLATGTQDHIGFPATASIIQEKLSLPHIPSFDVSAGCSGFVYAMEIARGLLSVGAVKTAVVIGSEKMSAITDWNDRNTCVLFGDGAGAVLLEANNKSHGAIIDTVLFGSGEGSSKLIIEEGGVAKPITEGSETSNRKLKMNGRAVYNFAVQVLGDVITELLKRNNVSIDEIDWIVPHQANERIVQATAKRLEIDPSKFYINIAEYANTSAASIPIALDEMSKRNVLTPGQLIMTVGFGAGLTYGGNIIRW